MDDMPTVLEHVTHQTFIFHYNAHQEEHHHQPSLSLSLSGVVRLVVKRRAGAYHAYKALTLTNAAVLEFRTDAPVMRVLVGKHEKTVMPGNALTWEKITLVPIAIIRANQGKLPAEVAHGKLSPELAL